MEKSDTLIELRKQKIESLRESGVNPYPSFFPVSHTVAAVSALIEKGEAPTPDDEQALTLAGRIIAVNKFGKSAFIRFRDRTGMMQAYIQRDVVGTEAYALFKQMDIGDFIGVTGGVFQTKTMEWTVQAREIKLLCKSTRPLPEKFHGLKDPEKRYRKRYLDLIMNSDTRDVFVQRSRIIQAVREFFVQREFMEVETPMMQPIPGGAEARPFVTHHNALDMELFLRIAPELYLKRLVIGGFERVFEINRNFRNEGVSSRHNPEFTMLEFYQAYADYNTLITTTEALFGHVVSTVKDSLNVTYQGNTIDFSPPWKRLTLAEAMHDIGGLDMDRQHDRDSLLDFAQAHNVQLTKTEKPGKILTKLFDALVEPKLIQPTFITGYPVEVSPLSKTSEDDPGVVDRFELFIAGNEIANGFSELNDPEDQRGRFMAQVLARQEGDEEAHYMDEDYIEALQYGMPPTAGEGIGIDRLVMLLTDAPSIREVILFPHMKKVSGEPSSPVDG